MSNLLKYARMRDDQTFVWRIAAAMMVRAQEIEFDTNQSTNTKALVKWVLDNPMIAPAVMINHVSTNPTIANNVSVTTVIDTTQVPDADIQYVVNQKWEIVANSMFTTLSTIKK